MRRPPAISGQIVPTRAGEEIELVETPSFRGAEARQDVEAGDVIRTNAYGQIALIFADRTQMRGALPRRFSSRKCAPTAA